MSSDCVKLQEEYYNRSVVIQVAIASPTLISLEVPHMLTHVPPVGQVEMAHIPPVGQVDEYLHFAQFDEYSWATHLVSLILPHLMSTLGQCTWYLSFCRV